MTLPQGLATLHQPVEDALRRLAADRPAPLYRMLEYSLGWIEQDGTPRPGHQPLRLYASLCLLTCQALGTDFKNALPAAAALELVHQFSLVHDDVQDGNPDRESRPAVWWVWGPAQAINAGDSLDALARLSILELAGQGAGAEEVVDAAKTLDQASLDLIEGQYQDIQFQEQLHVSQQAYLAMAEKRSGALLGCAAELGALSARAMTPQRQRCRQAGRTLGLALHIHNDILGLWGVARGRAPSGDVLNKKKSLPVIYALEHGDVQARRELGSLYLQRVLDPRDLPRIVELLDAAGSRPYCQRVLEQAEADALRDLAGAGLSDEAMIGFQELTGLLLHDQE